MKFRDDFILASRRYRFMREVMKIPNLYAYYPLNEVEGNVATNLAPATRGSLNGAITGATLGTQGKIGRAISFDGVGDYVLAFTKTLLVTSPYTIMMIFNSPTPPSGGDDNLMGVVHEAGANDPSLQINLNTTSGHLESFQRDDGGVNLAPSWAAAGNLATGVPIMLAYRRDPTTDLYSAFKNGVSMGGDVTDTLTGSQTLNTAFAIGATNLRGIIGQEIAATIQHFIWVDRAMTNAEILKFARLAGFS